jgi:hypothetical protein
MANRAVHLHTTVAPGTEDLTVGDQDGTDRHPAFVAPGSGLRNRRRQEALVPGVGILPVIAHGAA